jgi:hypothetical protein
MFIINLVLIYALLGVLVLIALNFILGVAIALKQHVFDIHVLPQTLETEILPYFIPLVALVAAAQFNFTALASTGAVAADFLSGLALALLASYAAKMVAQIATKLTSLFGDIPDSGK